MDKRLTRLGLAFSVLLVVAVAVFAGQTQFSVFGKDSAEPAHTQPPAQVGNSISQGPSRAAQAVAGSVDAQLLWGNVDCSESVDAVDALKLLRQVAALSVAQQHPCPLIGGAVLVDGMARLWGDVDCEGIRSSVDALKVLRFVAALSVGQTEPCPDIGQTVMVSFEPAPSPSPTPTAEPTPSPTATGTPEPSLTPTPTASATPEPTPSPSPTASPTSTPTPTPTPSPTPTPPPSSGVVAFLPFLFLGNPDYDCTLQFPSLDVRCTNPSAPQYTCDLTFNDSDQVVRSVCTGADSAPDYTCNRSGDSTNCVSTDGPEYNCSLSGSITTCDRSGSLEDYVCPSTGANTFDCNTNPPASFPDFSCVGSENPYRLTCQTKQP